MKGALFAVGLTVFCVHASHAEYFTYSDWSRMPANFRAAYIAGLYDALISIASDDAEARIGAHYQTCVARAKMRNTQLAENTLAYATARPELQSGGVGEAMIKYLIELCGKPPK
jgi:hypothetical protein